MKLWASLLLQLLQSELLRLDLFHLLQQALKGAVLSKVAKSLTVNK